MPQTRYHSIASGTVLSSYDINLMFNEIVKDCLVILSSLPAEISTDWTSLDNMTYQDIVNEILREQATIQFLSAISYEEEGEYTSNWRHI